MPVPPDASSSGIRLLVTGGAGFVGGHVLTLLRERRNVEVHAVSRTARAADGVHWHTADLLKRGEAARVLEAARPTHLLHLAWYTEHQRYWNAPENLAWTAASLELIEAFAAAAGRRAVFAGTCAEYDLRGEGPCREDVTPERPESLYGTCKLAAARIAQAYAAACGFEFAWGRIFYVFGPGEPRTRLIPSAVSALARGEPASCLRGADRKDYIYVRDAAAALLALVVSPVSGPVNIATGSPVSLEQLVRLVGERAGRPELVAIAAPAPGAAPVHVSADVSRLTGEVGWTQCWSLHDGVDETIAWMRAAERNSQV